MKIGCVKEIKTQEYRVGLSPENVWTLTQDGHEVWIESSAGLGSGYPDEDYRKAGAQIKSQEEVWKSVDLLIKVKEPLEKEYVFFRKDLLLFTYLHLAADQHLTEALLASQMTALAYETLSVHQSLPLLKPMSEIAGRLSIQEAAKYLEKTMGGKGLLLSGVPGVKRGHVLVLGAGVAGQNAVKIAVGMGANVTVLDRKRDKLEELEMIYGDRIQTLSSDEASIQALLPQVDIVVGAVLVAGAKAPQLIKRKDLSKMTKGSVLVDIAIDQGGCFETSVPTTHTNPIYEVDGIIHYCVANIPGCVPMTSTKALTNASISYISAIAKYGLKDACLKQPELKSAINTHLGKCTNQAVANTFNLEFVEYA